MKIAYYISAHGFGHASRQQAVVHILAQNQADVYIRSAAPTKFFPRAVDHHAFAYDVGMIQPTVMEVNPAATFAAYAELLTRYPELIRQEVTFLQQHQIQLVVTDMPPLACEIAAAAALPCVAITHFTWDWVYEHYVADFPHYRYIIERITAGYQKATLALQLQIPLPHEFTMFPCVETIAGIGNTVTKTVSVIRDEFAIPSDHRIGVLSMGGHEWGKTDIRALTQLKNWTFLVTPSAYAQVQNFPQFRQIPPNYQGFHNLMAAADVLVGKSGGTTVAEIIKHRTPIIYTLNENWRENGLLEETLRRYAHSQYLPKSNFERGEWVDLLESMANNAFTWTDIPMNGAEQAAARLLALLK